MAKNKLNQVYNIDSRHILESIPQNIEIQTTITSPPYFDMKDYGSKIKLAMDQIYEDYLNDLQNIFGQILKITKVVVTLWIYN